jgi:hypothetical protein
MDKQADDRVACFPDPQIGSCEPSGGLTTRSSRRGHALARHSNVEVREAKASAPSLSRLAN